MSSLIGYIAVVLLPLFYTEIPSLVVNRWYWAHRGAPLPAGVEKQAAREGRIAPFLAIVMLGLSIWLFISWTSIPIQRIGMSWDGWRRAFIVGVLAGLGWLGVYVLILLRFRPRKSRIAQHLLLQQSGPYWVSIGLSAAVIEEVWRAFCLVALHDQGQLIAIAATSLAAGWGHPHPRARALSSTLYAIYAAGLFLWQRSLWATVPAHALLNVGTLGLVHFAFRQARPE